MAKALENQGYDLSYISHLYENNKFLLNLKKAYYQYVKNQIFYRDRQPSVAKDFATQINRKLSGLAPDILFSPGSIPIAQLEHDAPIVFWTDSSFNGLIDYYPEFTGLCDETVRNGNMLEQKALDNCAMAIYSSQWAANDAIEFYNIDPKKVKIVPFGANLKVDRGLKDIEAIVSSKDFSTCELLFIGVDWERKGGDTVMKIAKKLHTNGTPVRLTIIGCETPKSVAESPLTEIHGFIDKDSSKGRAIIDTCLLRAHFLVVPSIAECFGIVYAEANSFGVPSIGRQTGGVEDAIKNGVNGMTFHFDAPIDSYCAFIEGYFNDRSKYRDIALNSFNEYETRLNWNSAGQLVKSHLNTLLS